MSKMEPTAEYKRASDEVIIQAHKAEGIRFAGRTHAEADRDHAFLAWYRAGFCHYYRELTAAYIAHSVTQDALQFVVNENERLTAELRDRDTRIVELEAVTISLLDGWWIEEDHGQGGYFCRACDQWGDAEEADINHKPDCPVEIACRALDSKNTPGRVASGPEGKTE